MFKTKIVSSQDKPLIDQSIEEFSALESITALGGERLSVQLLYTDEGEKPALPIRSFVKLTLEGDLAQYATMRDVRLVPADRPVNPQRFDDQYISTKPGLFPDLLTPLRYGGKVCPGINKLRSVWIEIEIPEDFSGESELAVTLLVEKTGATVTERVKIDVIPAKLPENELYFTQWFYADCLASYYNVESWSERHWRIVESFLRNAHKRGRNMIYTPLLTPALNVEAPFLRVPTQLVDVTLTKGEYSFDFTKLDRWVDLCLEIGFKYFEISHLYDQHHAKYAAKVYANRDGEYGLLFGWETLALDPEYSRFLRALIKAFVAHMKKRGDDKRCFYHVSDEPNLGCLEHYTAVKNVIADLLEGYRIMDALSDVDFYASGALDLPVPVTSSAMGFIERGVPNLWVYYACNEVVDYSNCYVAMPYYRTRSLGMQLYKYGIAGFLHWGYNYYNNRCSGDAINPYIDLGGEDWVPAGDTFMVYPGQDGTPLESTRLLSLEEAFQDIRAFKLCESLYSKERVISEIEAILGEEITFRRCAHSTEEMLAIRQRINELIKEKV